MTQLHQSRLAAHQNNLDKQSLKYGEMPLAKIAQGSKVGNIFSNDYAERRITFALTLETAAAEDPGAVTINQHGKHHLRMVRRLAA